MSTVRFDGYTRSVSEINPLLTRVEFVFSDFKPNGNKEGLPRTEAENIIKTGRFTPVKISFNGVKPAGHDNFVPVGFIDNLRIEEDLIVGESFIWNYEYPEVVNYLKTSFAEQEPAQFSWELFHKSYSLDTDGVRWLHDCTVQAVAIVDRPAYNGRTHLVAIAEKRSVQALLEERESLVNRLAHLNEALIDRGFAMSDNVVTISGDEVLVAVAEEETQTPAETAEVVAETTEMVAVVEEQVTPAASISPEDLQALTQELEDLRTYRNTIEQARHREETLTRRFAQIDEAGYVRPNADDFDQHLLAFDDEAFSRVMTIARLLKPQTVAVASQHEDTTLSIIPDPAPRSNAGATSIRDLAVQIRTASRTRRTN